MLKAFGVLLACAGAALLAIAAVVFIFQVFIWLKIGEWPDLPTCLAWLMLHLPPPNTGWVGIDQIMAEGLKWPVTISLLWMGIALITVGNWFHSAAEAP